MKNTWGNSVSVTLFGESHGAGIGAVLDGIAPGIAVDTALMQAKLDQRRAAGDISTPRKEGDLPEIVSGVFNGKTTGTPLCVLIRNENTKSGDYAKLSRLPRPGHADYTAYAKYHGYQDYRGGGHFSGRITAGLVAVGAVALAALQQKGIRIGTHIARCAGVEDRDFADLETDIAFLDTAAFPVLDEEQGETMRERIRAAKAEGDSVGGVLETVVTGLPAGVGEPWFDTVESVLSHGLFGIPAIKGVAFGDGFEFADVRGSDVSDAFAVSDGAVVTKGNHNGGINGGITNGMPLRIRCAVKPTPSIRVPQQTIDLNTMEEATLVVEGRHDPAVIHRARAVVDAVVAIGLCDLLAQRFGTDWLAPEEADV